MNKRSSSDEMCELFRQEVLPKYAAADILQSRQRCNLVCEQDLSNNIFETERTISSSSWGFDDFELKSENKITSSLCAVEDFLYDAETMSLNKELSHECGKWTNAFPHLRIKGSRLTITSGDSSMMCANVFSSVKSCQGTRDAPFVDEVIEQDATFESALQTPNRQHNGTAFKECTSSSVVAAAYIKHKVIEKLASCLWMDVVFCLKKARIADTLAYLQHDFLPPITYKDSSFELPKAKIRNLPDTDIPKLDGILTVSPKVLLPRPNKRAVGISKRGTLHAADYIALNSPYLNTSSKCCKPIVGSSSHAKFSGGRKTDEQILDVTPYCLPFTQEDTSSYDKVQHGKHVKLSWKDSLGGLVNESAVFAIKPQSFLPPIYDVNHSPLYSDQDMNNPITYKSCVESGYFLNHPHVYTRHLNQMNSRPSTSQLPI